MEKLLKQVQKRHKEVTGEKQEEELHSEMQYHLLKIGKALGYDVIAASNDRSRSFKDNKFSFLSLDSFPQMDLDKDTFNTISLIDIIWFEKGTNKVVSAFEVEKSTSIYSGILRLTDLAYSFRDNDKNLFLVVPDNREKEVVIQLTRPSIKNSNTLIHYILFSELRSNCDALCRFGDSHRVMEKIAKTV